jgi:hypothetical protein
MRVFEKWRKETTVITVRKVELHGRAAPSDSFERKSKHFKKRRNSQLL